MRAWLDAPKADRTLDIAVAALACGFAVFLFLDFLPQARDLWRDAQHDRNGHYSVGLNLAIAARSLDLPGWLQGLERTHVWPPVHGLVLSLVLLVGGLDERLGVVPSLAGFAATIWLSWKIARESLADRSAGLAAGLIAAALVAASPTLRLITTDVMLEGLGSALSAFCLFAFMQAWRKPQSRQRWRWLALGLTLLFFEKYNYWAFAAVGIAITGFALEPRVRGFVVAFLRAVPAGALALARRPVSLIGAVVMAAAIALFARGPSAIELFGRSVSLYPPNNLVTAGYALLFLGAVQVWRNHRDVLGAALAMPGRTLLFWHVLPVAVSFLLPKRLSTFLWFLGPTNNPAEHSFDPLGGLTFYIDDFVQTFNALPVVGWLAAAGVAVSVVLAPRMRPEARVVPVFLAVSLAALSLHPQHQLRFLSTSAFAAFVASGVGFALLMQALRVPATVTAAAGIAAASAVLGQLAVDIPAKAYTAAIRLTSGPSTLDIVDLYAPFVRPDEPLAVAATFGRTTAVQWPLSQARGRKVDVDQPWIGIHDDRAAVAATTRSWLEETPARQAVVIDVRDARQLVHLPETMAGVVDAIGQQARFSVAREIAVPTGGRVFILTRP